MEEEVGERSEVTLEEAVAIALGLLRKAELENADRVLGWVLEIQAEHADALHFRGWIAHQQGRNEEAVELIRRSLAVAPGYADAHSNLGVVLGAMGRLDEAILACRRAIELAPNHANAYSNLGVLLRATGRPAEAEAAYRTALGCDPDHVDALHNLGTLLVGQERVREAVECYCRVTTLRARHPQARQALALAHCTLGEIDRAIAIYEQWLRDEPGDPIAQHLLAACSGRAVPARASDAFVEKVFDDFAASFDAKLEKLGCRAPALVAAALETSGLPRAALLEVLDAGCGTGLCGPLIAPYARRLTGVDLAARMLERAAERQVYDALIKAELTAYLEAHPASFDLIVSADTLVYFGALEAVITAAARALRPRGLLIFSVEASDAADSGAYTLGSHGRYSHGSGYVEALLHKEGFAPDVTGAELRMEAGLPVKGFVIRAARS